MSQKEKERLNVEKRGPGEKTNIINFKDRRLPTSVLQHARHSLRDSETSSHLTITPTLKNGHFYPHNEDKETEAQVIFSKATELIVGRARTQTKANNHCLCS